MPLLVMAGSAAAVTGGMPRLVRKVRPMPAVSCAQKLPRSPRPPDDGHRVARDVGAGHHRQRWCPTKLASAPSAGDELLRSSGAGMAPG